MRRNDSCAAAVIAVRLRPFGGGRVATRADRFASHLGGDPDSIAHPWPHRQPAAEQRFTGPAVPGRVLPECIAIGGVDPLAAGVDVLVEQSEGGTLVDASAEFHRTQSNHEFVHDSEFAA